MTKKELTKPQKLRMLRGIREDVLQCKKDKSAAFFCFAWDRVERGVNHLESDLAKLGMNPPRKRFSDISWYHMTDYANRIKCIDLAIAKLQPKKK